MGASEIGGTWCGRVDDRLMVVFGCAVLKVWSSGDKKPTLSCRSRRWWNGAAGVRSLGRLTVWRPGVLAVRVVGWCCGVWRVGEGEGMDQEGEAPASVCGGQSWGDRHGRKVLPMRWRVAAEGGWSVVPLSWFDRFEGCEGDVPRPVGSCCSQFTSRVSPSFPASSGDAGRWWVVRRRRGGDEHSTRCLVVSRQYRRYGVVSSARVCSCRRWWFFPFERAPPPAAWPLLRWFPGRVFPFTADHHLVFSSASFTPSFLPVFRW